jgi:Flp pilus assembly pilin Flp
MNKFLASLQYEASRLTQNEEGASSIEYALIAGLIGVVIIAAAGGVGSAIIGKLNVVITALGGTAV